MGVRNDTETALTSAWSMVDYLTWQREQEERDEAEREALNLVAIERDDPECEQAVRALEEGWHKSQGRS